MAQQQKSGSLISSTDQNWHKASQDLGELPKAEYDELRTELKIRQPGQGYDLYWRTTTDGKVDARVTKSAPTGENQQSQEQALTRATFDKSDLSDRLKWIALKRVQQYDIEVGSKLDMYRRGSVQDNQAKEMPELNKHGLL